MLMPFYFALMFLDYAGTCTRIMYWYTYTVYVWIMFVSIFLSQVFRDESILVPITASMISGVAVVVFMTPFDVISTRLYNQGLDGNGRGLYYRGFLDCFLKVLMKEGPLGFYKGWSASWFRLAPHTVLSLVFWDQTRILYKNIQDSFTSWWTRGLRLAPHKFLV